VRAAEVKGPEVNIGTSVVVVKNGGGPRAIDHVAAAEQAVRAPAHGKQTELPGNVMDEFPQVVGEGIHRVTLGEKRVKTMKMKNGNTQRTKK
jgi:hypothetical protein